MKNISTLPLDSYIREHTKNKIQGIFLTFLTRENVTEKQIRGEIIRAMKYGLYGQNMRECLEESSKKAYKTKEFGLRLQNLREIVQETIEQRNETVS